MSVSVKQMLLALALVAVAVLLASQAQAANKHTVDFRLMNWRSMHFDDAKQAGTHFKALKSLGCEVELQPHNGHTDVRYRLNKWTTLALPTDEEAHRWQKYLRGMGFETRHSH